MLRDAFGRLICQGGGYAFSKVPSFVSKHPLVAVSAAGILALGSLCAYATASSTNTSGPHYSPDAMTHDATQQSQNEDYSHQKINEEIERTLAGFRKILSNDLQLSALFKEASSHAQANRNNAYTKACAQAVESVCMLSGNLKQQGFVQQAMAITHLANALTLASSLKDKRDDVSAAYASAEKENINRHIKSALRAAFNNLQTASSAAKEKFITSYRNYKNQLDETKIRDMAMAGVAVMLCGAPVSPLILTAAIEHLVYVLTTEATTVGVSGPIACTWEAIVEDASVANASASEGSAVLAGSNTLPAVASTFHAPTVIQPSVMAAHIQTIQTGMNAAASAANDKTIQEAGWGFWNDLPKATRNGKEYAQVNGRLYPRHIIDRMTPKYYGTAAGGDKGRGIPTAVVEDVIMNGSITNTEIAKNGATRITKSLDCVHVVLDNTVNSF